MQPKYSGVIRQQSRRRGTPRCLTPVQREVGELSVETEAIALQGVWVTAEGGKLVSPAVFTCLSPPLLPLSAFLSIFTS